MSFLNKIEKVCKTMNNGLKEANEKVRETYEYGLELDEVSLRKEILSSTGFRKSGYIKAYKEKFGK